MQTEQEAALEVAKWANSVAWRDTCVVVVGGDLGCKYWEVIRRYHSNIHLVRYDPKGDFTAEQAEGVNVPCTTDLHELRGIISTRYKPPQRTEVIGSDEAKQEYGAQLSAVVDAATLACAEAEHTTRVNAARWTELGLEALRQMNGHHTLNGIAPCLEGMTAVIVGAGPSLDKNIGVLAEAQHRCAIFACDAAVNSLRKAGIQPDVIVTVEANDTPTKSTWQSPAWRDAVVIPGVHVNKGVWRIQPKRWLWGVQMVGAIGPFILRTLELPVFKSGGSVTTIALSAAYMMGASRFVFVGMDSAYASDGKFYSDGVPWKDSRDRKKKEQLHRVEAWGGIGYVEAPRTLCSYREWFEGMTSHLVGEGREVVNATEGGARIQGTQEQPLRDALNCVFCERSAIDSIVEAVDQAPVIDGPKLAAALETEVEYARGVVAAAKESAEALLSAYNNIGAMLRLPRADILFRAGVGPIHEAGMMPRGNELQMGARVVGRLAEVNPALEKNICDTIKALR